MTTSRPAARPPQTRSGTGIIVADRDELAMKAIVAAVKGGKCILFLGAGVHAPPPKGSRFVYPPRERPPIGTQLSKHLAKTIELKKHHPAENLTNLQRTSHFFESMTSRNGLVNELMQVVQAGKQPSPALRALAELGFPIIVTTNYDQLLERALTAAGKEYTVGVYSPERKPTKDPKDDPAPDRPFVFKIHGDIREPSSIVITDEDYIQFILRMRDPEIYYPVPETFLFRFKRWTTLFVGYSLMDYNLRLLIKTLWWKVDTADKPDSYSVDLYPDPLIVDVLDNQQRYVTFIVQDLWTFVPELYERLLGKEMPDYRA